jgi:2,5-diketo-D-gluconate reductase A
MAAPSTIPRLTMSSGVAIPVIGLGTWPLDDAEVSRTVVDAVRIGYRLIDTAVKYGNEAGVGDGIRSCLDASSGLTREDLFVTTKLDGPYQGRDRAVGGLDASLRRLGLDYVDLLLIHWPLPRRHLYVDTWHTFVDLLASGRTRAIGVSNFKPAHLERLIDETGVTPAVNQIELNPALARTEARAYHEAHGIITQSWSPLGRGETLSNPVITSIAERLGRTPAQVILRWHVQLGLSAVPKSADPARLAQNLAIFDFELTEADLAAISGLDAGEVAARDSDVEGH